MLKKKKRDTGFEKLGLGTSMFLFICSWVGLLGIAFLLIKEVIMVVNNTTAKGIFFLPFYFAVFGLYVLLTSVFANRINKIIRKKSKGKKNGKKKKIRSYLRKQ